MAVLRSGRLHPAAPLLQRMLTVRTAGLHAPVTPGPCNALFGGNLLFLRRGRFFGRCFFLRGRGFFAGVFAAGIANAGAAVSALPTCVMTPSHSPALCWRTMCMCGYHNESSRSACQYQNRAALSGSISQTSLPSAPAMWAVVLLMVTITSQASISAARPSMSLVRSISSR